MHTQLPDDLQESIWTHYHDGLRDRIYRTCLQSHIRTLCLTDANTDIVLDWMAHMLQHPNVKPQGHTPCWSTWLWEDPLCYVAHAAHGRRQCVICDL